MLLFPISSNLNQIETHMIFNTNFTLLDQMKTQNFSNRKFKLIWPKQNRFEESLGHLRIFP
jgi:hypothetical protein